MKMLWTVAVVVSLGLVGLAGQVREAPESPTVSPGSVATTDWTMGYKPCPTEDSGEWCYWDAKTRGNGKGRSFVVTNDEVIYVDR